MRLAAILAPVGRRLFARRALRAATQVLAVSIGVLGAEALYDRLWPLGTQARCAVLMLPAALAAVHIVRLAAWWRGRAVEAARWLDTHGGAQRVQGALAFSGAQDAPPLQRELMQAEIQAVENLLTPPRRPPFTRAARAPLAFVLCAAAGFVLGPDGVRHQALRVLAPWRPLPPRAAAPMEWLWPPDGTTMPHGSTLTVEALVTRTPARPILEIKGARVASLPMSHAGHARYVAQTAPLTGDVVLVIRDAPFESPPRSVRVAPPEAFAVIEAVLTFPAYMRRTPERAAIGADRLIVPEGTRVELEAAGAAREGTYRLTAGGAPREEGPLEARNGKLCAAFTITEAGTVELRAGGAMRAITVECIPDRPPEILRVFPPSFLVACEGHTIPIEVTARDDHGLTLLEIEWAERRETRFPGNAPAASMTGEIEAAAAREEPVFVHTRARDNRTPSPQETLGPRAEVRIVTRAQYTVLRRLEGFAVLRRRLAALRDAATAIVQLAIETAAREPVPPEAAGRIREKLGGLAAIVEELLDDPVFAQEETLCAPLRERLEGVRKLARAPLPTRIEDLKAWVSLARYFAEELLTALDPLLADARAAAAGQPVLAALARASRLPALQERIVIDIEDGAPASASHAMQQRVRDAVQTVRKELAGPAPEDIAPLARGVLDVLAADDLDAALAGALDAMRRDARQAALDHARAAAALLGPIEDLLKASGEFRSMDLAGLLAALAAADDARAALGIERESLALWGPGAAQAPAADIAPLAAPMVLAVPPPPRVAVEQDDFYAPLVDAYLRVLHAEQTASEDNR